MMSILQVEEFYYAVCFMLKSFICFNLNLKVASYILFSKSISYRWKKFACAINMIQELSLINLSLRCTNTI